VSVLSITIYGCQNQPVKSIPPRQTKAYSYFEISFLGGWTGSMCFRADSTDIYFFPLMYPRQLEDSIKYGILPDSMQQLISKTIRLLKDSSVKSSGRNLCDDCSAVQLLAVTGKDSIKLFQMGDIFPPVLNLVNQLESLQSQGHHQQLRAFIRLSTAADLVPPPPPVK
jgi:hypothetical protein